MKQWPIFVLSLDDAQARRAPLIAQLHEFGLKFEIFPAIDGRSKLPAQYEPLIDRDEARNQLQRDMTDGEFACALSHYSIYKKVENEGLPGAIVLEDDAILSPLFKDFVCSGGYELADLTLLDHWFARVWRFSRVRITEGIETGRVSRVPCLTTGYSISSDGCDFIIKNSIPIRRSADWPCDITEIGARATIPRIVDHPSPATSTSHLETERQGLANSQKALIADKRYIGDRMLGWKAWLIKRASKKIS